jgi:hypothetical protein
MDEKETHKDFYPPDGMKGETQPDAETDLGTREPEVSDVAAGAGKSKDQEPVLPERQRLPGWLMTGVRWGIGVGLVFLLGALAVWWVYVGPTKAELTTTQAALTEAEGEVERLQGELDTANARIADLEIAEAQFQLLTAQLKATEAKAALLAGDVVETRVKLDSLNNALRPVMGAIEGYDATLATSLTQRLELIQTNLEGDAAKALIDLDLVIEDLKAVAAGLE